MRNAGGRGDLTQARALGMGFADRCTPSGVGLGATRRRPLYGCRDRLQLDVAFQW